MKKNGFIAMSSDTIYLDITAPTCTNSGDSTSWTSGSRTIYRGCSDGQSGCSTATASTTYSSTTRTATIAAYTIHDNAGNATSCPSRTANGAVCEITIKDNAGNSTVCTSPKNRVDTIAPICNYAGYTNSTILTVTCSDSNSGCKTSSGTISSTAKKVTLYDNAGNSCAIQCDYSTSGLITICYSIN